MSLQNFFVAIKQALELPAVIIFLGTGILLTLKTFFLQFRGIPRLFKILKKTIGTHPEESFHGDMRTINPFHALFTAMGTTIGMGNLVGPPLAVFVGGPGALFWLIVYIFFSSVTKFVEVTFAIKTRSETEEGYIIGGPMQYLKWVHPLLAYWYAVIMVFVFLSWTSLQSNTLAEVFGQEGMPHWITGMLLAAFSFVVLRGGSKRVGEITSKLVPFMFCFYVFFALYFLLSDLPALRSAFLLIWQSAFSQPSLMGFFAGATMYEALKVGVYKGVFITEAGMGTSSIPHAVAQVDHPTDQGILALFSMISDAFLSMISGLLVIVTGVWLRGNFRSTLVYEAFKIKSPTFGGLILLVTITLFVITTVIGNVYNGRQTFGSLTNFRGVFGYTLVSVLVIFLSAVAKAELVWHIMNFLLPLVAIPNLLGIVYLSFKYPDVLRLPKE